MASFPTPPKDAWLSRGVTLYEKQMLQFVVDMLHEPDRCAELLSDDGLWRLREDFNSAVARDERLDDPARKTYVEKLFQSALCDLERKRRHATSRGVLAILDAEFEILQSDGLVPDPLRESLAKLAGRQARAGGGIPWESWSFLSDIWLDEDSRTRWKIRGVLDPLLYPAVRGRTRTLTGGNRVELECAHQWMGRGDVETTDELMPRDGTYDYANAESFQTLPSEVRFRADGSAQIASYINGLHTSVWGMYGALEQVLDVVIPQWQRVLGTFGDCRRIVPDEAAVSAHISKLQLEGWDWWRPRPRLHPEIAELRQESRGRFTASPMGEQDVLQVVFHMDAITGGQLVYFDEKGAKLTRYPSWFGDSSRGKWRRPAPFSDDVVAMAVYCYEADGANETGELDIRLQLKQGPRVSGSVWERCIGEDAESSGRSRNAQFADDMATVTFEELYRGPGPDPFNPPYMDPEQPSDRELLGAVKLTPGRLVVFPANVDYRFWVHNLPVSGGGCGVLTMALVDPRRPRGLSTATVPPQSRDYWLIHIRALPWFRRLPEELWLLITEELDSAEGGEENNDDGNNEYAMSRRAAREISRRATAEARHRTLWAGRGPESPVE